MYLQVNGTRTIWHTFGTVIGRRISFIINIMRRLFIISLCLGLSSFMMSAQELTSSVAYKAYMDSLETEFGHLVEKWNRTIPPHFMEAMRLEKEAEAHPELKDSLLAIAAEERRIGQSLMASLQPERDRIQEERIAIMQRYALVFEEAFPYFRMRKQYTKDSLSVLLKKSSPAIKKSCTGTALKKYIKHNQLGEGGRFKTVRCYDVNGKRFDWGLCKGKKVFLIHDGLWCMTHGTDNSFLRKYLQHITESAPECLPLIFVDCETNEGLRESIEEYGLQDYIVVSEFRKDLGTLNWLYNDTTTPTCHYIDEQGILVKSTEGIDSEYLEKEFLKIK